MISLRSRNPLRSATLVSAGALALLVPLMPQAATAAEVVRDRQQVHDFASGEPIPGTRSVLWRVDDEDGDVEEHVASRVRTKAERRHALTLWYVVFNDPGECNTDGCGEDDIFGADGKPDLEQIDKAGISVVSAGRGAVVGRHGHVRLSGGLAEDEVPTGPGRVVIGETEHGALIPSSVTGILDVEHAEVHLVIQDHGKAHRDRKLRRQQLTQFHGACNPECVDIQFAVHK